MNSRVDKDGNDKKLRSGRYSKIKWDGITPAVGIKEGADHVGRMNKAEEGDLVR